MFKDKTVTTPWELNVTCRNCHNKFALKSEKDIFRVNAMLCGAIFPRYYERFFTRCPECNSIRKIPKILISKEIRKKCLNLCD